MLFYLLEHYAPLQNALENQESESANIITENNSLQCPYCRKTYSSKYNLKTHIGRKHPNRSINVEENSTNSETWLSCQHCDRKFLTKTGLNIHCGRKHTISKVPDAGENVESESDLDTVSQSFYNKSKIISVKKKNLKVEFKSIIVEFLFLADCKGTCKK